MIIALVGPDRWREHLARELTDRVSDIDGKPIKVVFHEHQLRGSLEHISVIIAQTGEQLSFSQQRFIYQIDRLNHLVDKRG